MLESVAAHIGQKAKVQQMQRSVAFLAEAPLARYFQSILHESLLRRQSCTTCLVLQVEYNKHGLEILYLVLLLVLYNLVDHVRMIHNLPCH